MAFWDESKDLLTFYALPPDCAFNISYFYRFVLFFYFILVALFGFLNNFLIFQS